MTSSAPREPFPLAAAEAEALRAEHDLLARRCTARRSIDDVRRGAYAAFGLFVSGALAVKFAWDRWGWGPRPARPPGRYPLLFLGALAVAIVLLVVAVRAFRSARRTMVVEDRDFARLKEIRGRLGIDA
jgi:hypothetical protein